MALDLAHQQHEYDGVDDEENGNEEDPHVAQLEHEQLRERQVCELADHEQDEGDEAQDHELLVHFGQHLRPRGVLDRVGARRRGERASARDERQRGTAR